MLTAQRGVQLSAETVSECGLQGLYFDSRLQA